MRAAQLLRRAIDLDPNVASYHANLGEIERQAEHLDEAQHALETAIRLDLSIPPASVFEFGHRLFRPERIPNLAAAGAYDKAIELQPIFPEAHNNLGNAYRALERTSDALACYQHAVTQKEGYAEAYNNMASALKEGGDAEAAEHAYRKAINLKPNYIEAHKNLALLLLYADRTEEALRVLADALKINEQHVTEPAQCIGKVQLKRGAYGVAEQAVQMALKIDENRADAYISLAEIYHELDRPHEALAQMDRVLSLDSEIAEAHNFQGVLFKLLGASTTRGPQFAMLST